ncbi:MAG: ABC transporter permease, partial [Deltaproteobacteria bacterium]|nr:ABC transporter permease [Deltaproteobacteria bacterium]
MKRFLISILALFTLWALFSLILGEGIWPAPWVVAQDLGERLGQKSFYQHLGASFYRASWGFGLGLALALPLGWLMGGLKKLDAILSPLLFLTYPVPKVLFLPVLIVALGLG